MKKIKMIFTGILICLLTVLFCFAANAHSLWINFTDYIPRFNEKNQAKSKIYMGWGHHFPVDSYVKDTDFEKITILSPSNKEENIHLDTTGFAAKEINFKEKGMHVIAVTRKCAYNTSYIEDGKIKQIKGTKEGHTNIISSTYSQQFAKSLLYVDSGNAKNLSHEFGQKLEIIPLTNPYGITNNRGSMMKIKVLFNGKPVQFTKVFAMYEGYASGDMASCAVSTDHNGIAEIRIDHWGVWVIKTRLENPVTQKLADKVNQENYFASLTFYVK